ncbi:sigma-54-dependent Fis family transcriptional regulator [Pseudomonas aeruginosa]|uniref:sigma-54-dependent Fis family transcriptional regulator n=1 Tax=Pseudomonas aeruginosa TaxID=287 RepID=UPI0007A7F4AB|nr:sigma-54-dependent Fis family transcriptional regulator [Pseudomonas aeruginosa]KYO76841.1 Formate hydrogenlyase transcriptional activator [Pseudomonas aeruginosa]
MKSNKNNNSEDRSIVADLALPEVHALVSKLHFSPNEGRIWLDESRCVLLQVETLKDIYKELQAYSGPDYTREFLTRIGFTTGQRDAEMIIKKEGVSSIEKQIYAGGVLHALQGFLTSIQVGSSVLNAVDMTSKDYHAEAYWQNSIEAEIHLAMHGVSSHGVCWFSVAYCSGYLSTCAGTPIVVKELECQAMGHPHCRIQAKPAEMWALSQSEQSQVATHPIPDDDQGDGLVIGSSAVFKVLRHKTACVAETDATVLLLGESGSGKSLIAREIHRLSNRADQAFVEVNCAAIPDQLIESELFGVERGAFTGATATREGRFEAAHQGTLFLDEIATLSMTAQSKLLRVLQNGELERLGSNRTIHTSVRLIAATNADLKKAVQDGHFREDLYYRLNVFPIQIPPLRERRDDISLITSVLIARFSKRHGRKLKGISSAAMQVLIYHDWPGNIRELENVIERAIIMAQDVDFLDTHHLTTIEGTLTTQDFLSLNQKGDLTLSSELIRNAAENANPKVLSLDEFAEQMVHQGSINLDQVQDAITRAAVKHSGGNISRAASLLGITRARLDYRVKKIT